MNDRYREYRRIADAVISRLDITVSSGCESELSKEYLATPQELATRAAFIRALTEEFNANDKL